MNSVKTLLFLTFSLILLLPNLSIADDLETSICGLKEPIMFWAWSMAAGDAATPADIINDNISSVELLTKDERILKGYKFKSKSSMPPRGYILFIQGNAMLADQMIAYMAPFSPLGYDVYIFDFRGYGRSTGKRRLKAIFNDYIEIATFLNSKKYDQKVLYGVSLGGMILLNTINDGVGYDAAIVDSSPSNISKNGCPEANDPTNIFPEDGSKILLIHGKIDKVITIDEASALLNIGREKGATVIIGDNYSHPYMDRNVDAHRERINHIKNFIKSMEEL